MKRVKLLLFILIILVSYYSSFGQFIEDALRYTIPNSMLTPRSASLGVSFYGISDDVSALIYNPAGLSYIGHSEFSLGLGFTTNISETEYLWTKNKQRANSAYFTHLGISVPIEGAKQPIIGAIAYFHENNFLNYHNYSSFNPKSSIVNSLASNGPKDTLSNIPYFLWLANNKFYTPIKDSVQQTAYVDEDGGLHNITGGFSIMISPNVSIGATIAGKWGKFKYYREFLETDILNKYNFFDSTGYQNVDFSRFTLKESINQKVIGITGSIGVVATIGEFFRFGATVKFPTYYEIEENFRQDAYAVFDNGWKPNPFEPKEDSHNSYKVTTPFVFAGGLSIKVADWVITGGVEYFDVTQLRFSDAPPSIEQLNSLIVRELVGQVNWGLGVQYFLPLLPLELRAGFSSITSPYQQDISGATTYIYSLGAALNLAPNIRLEPTFQLLTNSLLRTNYQTDDPTSKNYQLNIQAVKIGLQFTYRY